MESLRLALLVATVVATSSTLNAYYHDSHEDIFFEAVGMLSTQEQAALRDLINQQTFREELARVDDRITNDDKNQYRHSMRSRGMTTDQAKKRTEQYRNDEYDAAVNDARPSGGISKREEVSEHLARVIHAVQDEKHNWTSCNRDTNGAASRNPCYLDRGPCAEGAGNHNLGPDCEIPDKIPRISDLDLAVYEMDAIRNYQVQTTAVQIS